MYRLRLREPCVLPTAFLLGPKAGNYELLIELVFAHCNRFAVDACLVMNVWEVVVFRSRLEILHYSCPLGQIRHHSATQMSGIRAGASRKAADLCTVKVY